MYIAKKSMRTFRHFLCPHGFKIYAKFDFNFLGYLNKTSLFSVNSKFTVISFDVLFSK